MARVGVSDLIDGLPGVLGECRAFGLTGGWVGDTVCGPGLWRSGFFGSFWSQAEWHASVF